MGDFIGAVNIKDHRIRIKKAGWSQEGKYSIENKKKSSFSSAVYTAYWVIASAIYLGYSLISNNWGKSYIILTLASVIFSAVAAITNAIDKKSK